MRKPSLKHRTAWVNGRIASPYAWRGETIYIHDSADVALELLGGFGESGQPEGLLDLLFACPIDYLGRSDADASDLMATVLWDAFGIDASEDHRHSESYEDPVFDWDQDAARIRASLLSAYGIDWNDASARIPYVEICALLSSLMEGGVSPFQQAIKYRTGTPPRANKYNHDEREAWEALRAHYALEEDAAEEDAGFFTDEFAALKRLAGGA